jgi:hypothetical protein
MAQRAAIAPPLSAHSKPPQTVYADAMNNLGTAVFADGGRE